MNAHPFFEELAEYDKFVTSFRLLSNKDKRNKVLLNKYSENPYISHFCQNILKNKNVYL